MLLRTFTRLILGTVLLVSALPERPTPDFDSGSLCSYDCSKANQHLFEFDRHWHHEAQRQDEEYRYPGRPHCFPSVPPIPAPVENRTIYQVLSDDPDFSRLVRVVDISDEVVSLLNDSSANITFFATPNSGLHLPHKGPPRKHPHHAEVDALVETSGACGLSEVISLVEELEISSLDNKVDKKKHKKVLIWILRAILAYHILPAPLDVNKLSENTTYATNLTLPDGSLDGQPLRIRVDHSLLPPSTKINLLTKVVRPNIESVNGIIHVIDHPLFPPPSIFQELFNVPSAFSTLTSALQRTGLTNDLDLRYVPGKHGKKGSLHGNPATTFFAPTNRAFQALPKKLQLFLFSPFGERILKKLLEFHIVPDLVIHSDYIYNKSSDTTASSYTDAGINTLEIPEIEEWSEAYSSCINPVAFETLHTTSCDSSDGRWSFERYQWLYHAETPGVSKYGDDVNMNDEMFEGYAYEQPESYNNQEHHIPNLSHNHPSRHCSSRPPLPPPCQRRCSDPPPPCRAPSSHHRPFPPGGETHDGHHHSHPPPPPQHDWHHDNLPCPTEGGRDWPRHHINPPPPPSRQGGMRRRPPFSQGKMGSDDTCHHFRPLRRCACSFPSPPSPPGGPCHPSDSLHRGPPRKSQHPGPHPPSKDHHFRGPPGHPVYAANLTLPTLLTNHSLHAHIEKFTVTLPIPGPYKPHKIIVKFFVNGQPVLYPDVVARNGAVHIIDKLLKPKPRHRRKEKQEDGEDYIYYEDDQMSGWEDWEEWLPQWALES